MNWKKKKKNSLNMYGIHVLEHRCTFFLRFSPSVLHANVQLNKTFKKLDCNWWTLVLWVLGQITSLTAEEKYVYWNDRMNKWMNESLACDVNMLYVENLMEKWFSHLCFLFFVFYILKQISKDLLRICQTFYQAFQSCSWAPFHVSSFSFKMLFPSIYVHI